MAQKINHTAIGAFVVGAIALIVMAILAFGTGNLFETDIKYTINFDTSVNGLAKGSPVMFRGIRIGEVTSIKLSYDSQPVPNALINERISWPIQVTVKLFPRALALKGGADSEENLINTFTNGEAREALEKWLADMVLQKGMRAQLQTQNMLTGLLYIELDLFHEETPTDDVKKQLANHMLPTRISAFERIYLSLNQNDFSTQVNQIYHVVNVIGKFFEDGKAQKVLENLVSVSNSMNNAMVSINEIISDVRGPKGKIYLDKSSQLIDNLDAASVDLKHLLKKFNSLQTDAFISHTVSIAANADEAVAKLREYLSAASADANGASGHANLVSSLSDTIGSLKRTLLILEKGLPLLLAVTQQSMAEIKRTADLKQGPLAQLIESVQNTTASINTAANEAQKVMQDVHGLTGEDSQTILELNKTLEEARQTLQSVRLFTDMLQASPEVLLRGK